MPFEWNRGDPAGPNPEKFRAQYIKGIRERARLLCNLGYSAERTVARIQADLRFEFDADFASTPLPAFYTEVPGLVDAAFVHAGRAPAKKARPKAKRKKK